MHISQKQDDWTTQSSLEKKAVEASMWNISNIFF